MKVAVYPDLPQLYAGVADFLLTRVKSRVDDSGKFSIALSGGSTPRGLYHFLTDEPYRSGLPWNKMEFFWGDERCVPKDHPESNFRLAFESFLAPLSIASSHLHRIVVEGKSPPQAAGDYEQHLRRFFRLRPHQYPVFDLILLGMGADGHTASLFPGGPELKVRERLVTWAQSQPSSTPRISLTLDTINRAKNVVFLITGKEKAPTLKRVLDRDQNLPAARVKPLGRLVFFVDQQAFAR